MQEKKQDPQAVAVIARLGGQTKVAQLCEIKPPSVHGWLENGIPKARLMFLKLARPDAFSEPQSEGEAA